MKDDVISRQDAIDAILSKPALHGSDGSYYHADDIRNAVMQLPSAEPERETGRWIRDEFGSRCGACGLYAYRDKFDRPWESPYCPNCGCRMMEVEHEYDEMGS